MTKESSWIQKIESAYKEKNLKELAALDFEKRSDGDKEKAIKRPSLTPNSLEGEIIDDLRSGNDGLNLNDFAIDVRIIRTNPMYKRLSNMGLVAPSFSHHFENRLTHTDDVSEISNKIARLMGLGEESIDLVKANSLAHDMGHAPFSHEAEKVFNDKFAEANCGKKWDHDYFLLDLFTNLAHFGTGSGIPVTIATLEGMTKRFKRYSADIAPEDEDYHERHTDELPKRTKQIDDTYGGALHLDKWNTIEGQIASTADWMAGNISDIRDVLKMELHSSRPVDFEAKFEEISSHFPLANEVWQEMKKRYADDIKQYAKSINNIKNDRREAQDANEDAKVANLNRSLEDLRSKRRENYVQAYEARMEGLIDIFSMKLENLLIKDILNETHNRFKNNKLRIHYAEDIRDLDRLLVSPSEEIVKQIRGFEAYLKDNVYPGILNNNLNTVKAMGHFFDLVQDSFNHPEKDLGSKVPIDPGWQKIYDQVPENDVGEKLGLVAAYITCNFSDVDVVYFLRGLKPETYAELTEGKQRGMYPPHQNPSPRLSVKALVERKPLHPQDPIAKT